jgi:hypothetical protein
MPLPRNDQLLNSDRKFTEFYPRCTDLSDYDAEALVPGEHFSKLLHPFVASISGTMLMFLECSLLLFKKGQLPFGTIDKFHPLITVVASLFLAFSGSHSFYEFMYPVFMPAVKADF